MFPLCIQQDMGAAAENLLFQGACGNCPGALMTIKMFIEQVLKEEVPGFKEVIGV